MLNKLAIRRDKRLLPRSKTRMGYGQFTHKLDAIILVKGCARVYVSIYPFICTNLYQLHPRPFFQGLQQL